jgi:hypothetical protein
MGDRVKPGQDEKVSFTCVELIGSKTIEQPVAAGGALIGLAATAIRSAR